ncbi:MAG TPA: transposase [Ignavibacteriaceae bacterium]|nr:transposase [Ignavibacteriaceae bacterium]
MDNKKSLHIRRSMRLKEFDYSNPWWYYVTICTYQKRKILGEVNNSKMILNEFGKIVEEKWLKTKEIRKNVDLDYYVIMPNHIHGIIIIESTNNNVVGATRRVAPTKGKVTLQPGSLGSIIGQFKSIVTKRLNKLTSKKDITIWQRNYYDHIIRNENDLHRIRTYIHNNPLKWELDEYYKN